ncbi:undecaprenyldiphospho-muramoylpentapeptide beta-N-acetylglucosaminyltransferase [Saccharibacillus sp. CPCC 101409]|uniref:undecaprenyldiphospho-muramoylpentapeptide beta-N-acetylglucosaminyltransferase n=1 Tax=Saccharibacillus sp. CPCC 101409 TaxID=3058041 RepID=UPI00267346E9|nr:undecaprenyldiphospho-muramoylpentapeptide beta-N-acetylglucosaminyltransferase [Saccharibacillus sp. CPCC 101409]MDO3411074.1 undecaprenyldiphospho-muramoylpentapeptide beta-N-acetylglucosaminyltransferase [Saccharibacillus sp. CPCC 101409]
MNPDSRSFTYSQRRNFDPPQSSPRRIVLTGGGSAGHVSVNLALIPVLQQRGWDVDYIGSDNGIEKKLIAELPDVSYHAIATGKLRRYFSLQNFTDPFRVLKGVGQSRRLIRQLKPDVVFSKGGFVSVPVVFGAWLNRVPALIHESDYSPGLANRLALPFASALCTTFPETAASVNAGRAGRNVNAKNKNGKGKAVQVGSVVRPSITAGDTARGFARLGFDGGKPVLLAAGGSLGSQALNGNLRRNLSALLERFDVVHLCGRSGLDPRLEGRDGYRQFEFLNEELPDVLAAAGIVFSRAGSNAIFEFLALRRPMLLCPLGRSQSRGDQILNADSFVRAGYAESIDEESWSDEEFLRKLDLLLAQRETYAARMEAAGEGNSLELLLRQIEETVSR